MYLDDQTRFPIFKIPNAQLHSLANDQVIGHLPSISGIRALQYLARLSKFLGLKPALISKSTKKGLN